MNKNIIKVAVGVLLGASVTLTSCSWEPDDSSLYTFTGQTIQDFLEENDSLFHQFNVIMKRSGYDRMMDTYGQYTCYAPLSEGVDAYIDSLYNDTLARIPHNGLTENSVDGLSEEQCKEIARYHLSAMMNSYVEQLSNASGKEISTMLNTPFISKLDDDGVVRLNNEAEVTSYDHEMTNGYVHVINKMIPRTTQRLPEVLERNPEFTIFYEALVKCGLDSLLLEDKKLNADGSPRTYHLDNKAARPGYSDQGPFHVPDECKIKFTIFAEDNATFAKYGIHDFASLKAKCVEWYGNAADWYDYPDKESNPISTGDDYEYTYNVVNMFMRYHILNAGMEYRKLVYTKDVPESADHWNFAFGGEPYDYYETLLPHTLMKIWQPLYQNTGSSTTIWINRWRQNNTLTDQVGTFGSDATHQILRDGCMVQRPPKSNIQTYNGYIHRVDRPLVYDAEVPAGVLNERLRIDMGTILPELINNDIRFVTTTEAAAMNIYGTSGGMVRLPLDYFDNLISYNTKTKLAWYTLGVWRAWQANQLSGWDENDFAFRLPPVPTGDYEIRIIYPPMANGGLQQYYIGTSNEPSSMRPLGIPIDARYPNSSIEGDRLSTGYLLSEEFTDYGVASDLVMRNHGYMRAPASFSRGTLNTVLGRITTAQDLMDAGISACCRYEEGYGTSMMRKIVSVEHLEQGETYWIRLKNLLRGYDQLGFSIDFIELVPVSVVNSQDLTEDWY